MLSWGRVAALFACECLGAKSIIASDWVTAGCELGRGIEAIDLLQHRATPVSETDVRRPAPTSDMLSSSRCQASQEEEVKYGMKVLSVKQNNLGGLGPDKGVSELRLHVEMGRSRRTLDLVIVNSSVYRPNNVDKNGVEHGSLDLFRINVKGGGTNTDFNVTFVDPSTRTPVVLEDIFITWFDVDKYNAAMTEERLYVKDFVNYSLTHTSDLTAEKEGEWTMVKPVGKKADMLPAAEAADRSIRLHYKNASGFVFKCVMMGPAAGGWNFMFSGIAAIPRCQQTQPTPQGYSCDIFGDPRTPVDGNSSAVFVESDPSGLLLRTFDGNQAYLHGMLRDRARTGDMWLVRSRDVNIQGRFGFAEKSMKSYLQAVALSGPFLDNNTLILSPSTSKCFWGEEEILMELGSTMELELPSGKFIKAKYQPVVQNIRYSTRTTAGVEVALPLGMSILLNRFEAFVGLRINFKSSPHPGLTLDGGCGNLNGDPSDDDLMSLEARMDPFVRPNESLFQQYNFTSTPVIPDSYAPKGSLETSTFTTSPAMTVTSIPAHADSMVTSSQPSGEVKVTTVLLGTTETFQSSSWTSMQVSKSQNASTPPSTVVSTTNVISSSTTMPLVSSLQESKAKTNVRLGHAGHDAAVQQQQPLRNAQLQVQTHIPVVFAAPLEFLFGNANR